MIRKVELQTPLGTILGARLEHAIEYRGIRYATAGRWEAPVLTGAWEGVFDASESFGKKCYQYHWDPEEFYGKEYYTDPSYDVPESEDCLYLTVTVPDETVPVPEGGFPVAVWYHGGGMVNGWGTEQEFDGEGFAQRGVILVRVNERLNIFGAFYHSKLVERDGSCGNYQVLDHFAALDWVIKNISAFSGNPEKVSIFGQSAGSMGVETMLFSPLAEGKIYGAVMQSGISHAFAQRPTTTLGEAIAASEAYLDSVGLTFEDFLNMPASELYEKYSEPYREFIGRSDAGYGAVIDGKVVVKPYDESLSEGRIYAKYYMAGCCGDDLRMDGEKPEDGLMYRTVQSWCSSLNALGKPAYFYFFNRKMPGDDAGAFHSADLWYVFGTYPRCWRPLTEEDAALSARMQDAWADFFKTGSPDPTGAWKPCTQENGYVQWFDV